MDVLTPDQITFSANYTPIEEVDVKSLEAKVRKWWPGFDIRADRINFSEYGSALGLTFRLNDFESVRLTINHYDQVLIDDMISTLLEQPGLAALEVFSAQDMFHQMASHPDMWSEDSTDLRIITDPFGRRIVDPKLRPGRFASWKGVEISASWKLCIGAETVRKWFPESTLKLIECDELRFLDDGGVFIQLFEDPYVFRNGSSGARQRQSDFRKLLMLDRLDFDGSDFARETDDPSTTWEIGDFENGANRKILTFFGDDGLRCPKSRATIVRTEHFDELGNQVLKKMRRIE